VSALEAVVFVVVGIPFLAMFTMPMVLAWSLFGDE
jgi:hypothetical protein